MQCRSALPRGRLEISLIIDFGVLAKRISLEHEEQDTSLLFLPPTYSCSEGLNLEYSVKIIPSPPFSFNCPP
jgi:hypothetical protein